MKIAWIFGVIALLFSSCTYIKIIWWNYADVTDHKLFNQKPIAHANQSFDFIVNTENIELPPVQFWAIDKKGKKVYTLDLNPEEYMENNKTTALLIIRRDTLIYENYFNGYVRNTASQHFSITKAVVSLLTAIAIEEGHIKSRDQPISDFIPMYANDERGMVTIGQLLNMTAGFDCNDYEDHVRFIRLYYSRNPQHFMKQRKLRYEPGEQFAYSSFNILLLGICLEKATGQSLNLYLQEKLWKHIGTSLDASLGCFNNGTPMAYGGLTSYPIDLVKFGRLLLHNGAWNGVQIVPKAYIAQCKSKAEDNGKSWKYSNCFWLDSYRCLKEEEIETLKWQLQTRNCDDEKQIYAAGYKGQVLYIDYEKELIILHLGTSFSKKSWSLSISKMAEAL